MASRIDRLDRLSDQQVHAVQRLVAAAPGASDNPPISEGALLQLRSGEPVRHLLATDAELSAEATGYAQLAPSPHGPTAELVAVDAGAGTELLGALERLAGADGLRLWAHGADSIAGQAARQAGLVEVRALLQLRRSLADLQLPPPELPAGVRIRAFVPGRDDRRWLAVNARAFADHPEQGSWTERELAERLSAS
ncbi:MAG: mycothiol synthase, partial [Jatrophihabitans sp.]